MNERIHLQKYTFSIPCVAKYFLYILKNVIIKKNLFIKLLILTIENKC